MIDLDAKHSVAWQAGALVISGPAPAEACSYRSRNEAFEALCRHPGLPPAMVASVLAFTMVLALDEHDRRSSALIEDRLMASLRAATLRCPDNGHVATMVRRLHDCFDLHSHLLDAAETRARLLMEARRIEAARSAINQRLASLLTACDPAPLLADDHEARTLIDRLQTGTLRHVAIQAWACARNGDAAVRAGLHAVAIACRQVEARCTLICPTTALRPACQDGRDLRLTDNCDMIPAEMLDDRCSEHGWNQDLAQTGGDLPPSPL